MWGSLEKYWGISSLPRKCHPCITYHQWVWSLMCCCHCSDHSFGSEPKPNCTRQTARRIHTCSPWNDWCHHNVFENHDNNYHISRCVHNQQCTSRDGINKPVPEAKSLWWVNLWNMTIPGMSLVDGILGSKWQEAAKTVVTLAQEADFQHQIESTMILTQI